MTSLDFVIISFCIIFFSSFYVSICSESLLSLILQYLITTYEIKIESCQVVLDSKIVSTFCTLHSILSPRISIKKLHIIHTICYSGHYHLVHTAFFIIISIITR